MPDIARRTVTQPVSCALSQNSKRSKQGPAKFPQPQAYARPDVRFDTSLAILERAGPVVHLLPYCSVLQAGILARGNGKNTLSQNFNPLIACLNLSADQVHMRLKQNTHQFSIHARCYKVPQ